MAVGTRDPAEPPSPAAAPPPLDLPERHGWSPARLAEHRRTALRATLGHATERSAWHRDRLRDLAVEDADPDDLRALPTMTKTDLMAHWDAIVTDPELRLAAARAHLAHEDEHGFSLLLGRYFVFTTGGSTGEPGVFCWSLEEMARWGGSATRWFTDGLGPPGGTAWVAARSARHPSGIGPLLTGGTPEHSVPVDQPLADIVARLNELQPAVLMVVCSMLPALVDAAEHGDLRLAVSRIGVFGDVLDRDAARRARDVFGVAPLESYPTTDAGHLAHQAPGEEGLYVNEDLLVVEAVDADEQPVAPGELSDHLLVTSLHQWTLPLIRYRIDDRVAFQTTPGRQAPFRRIATIDGRSDDVFRYGSVIVHPHVFRTTLGRHPAIRDFQVTQRADGADVVADVQGELDTEAVAAELRAALGRAGLADARISVTAATGLGRTAVGKRRLFVPLPQPAA